MNIAQIYRIEEGNLRGTEIRIIGGLLGVYYPHRLTGDLYVPPMEAKGRKKVDTFHCCQEGCATPDFEGSMPSLIKHLELHAGRLLKRLPPLKEKVKPRVVVSLPQNPWGADDHRGANPDRRFVVEQYIASVKEFLFRQGIGVTE